MHTAISTLIAVLAISAEPSLHIRPEADPRSVRVTARVGDLLAHGGVSQEQGERLLRLALVDTDTGREGPAILGRYECRQGTLIFTPRYPLGHDQLYRASLSLPGVAVERGDYRVPSQPRQAPSTVVEQVYPSAAVLPANLLKFYVHFSKPMREGREVFDRIRILDERGEVVHEPWRRTELWNADATRLTLWIHPGRTKQGVNLREEEGPVLHAGRRYTLEVGTDLLDADGRTLAKPFRKAFRTTAEDHDRPLPDGWTVEAPVAGRVDPLVLHFGEPLDRALLTRFLRVVNEQGRAVEGRIEVGAEERSWAFLPRQPWSAAEYSVRVDAELEDVAGNTPERPFDLDLSQPPPRAPRLRLPFHPR